MQGRPDTIEGGTDYASRIARPFPAGVNTAHAGTLPIIPPGNTDRGGSPRFHTDEIGLGSDESGHCLLKLPHPQAY